MTIASFHAGELWGSGRNRTADVDVTVEGGAPCSRGRLAEYNWSVLAH